MTSQDTRVTDLSRLKWVWEEFARKHRGLLFLAICLMAVQGSVVGGISYLMEPMFDRVFVEGARDALVWVGGSIFALFAIRALANSGQRVILCFVTEQIASTMRQTIVAQAVRLDTAYHNSHPPGYMLERVQGDPSIIMRDCSAVVTALGRDAVALVVLMAVAIHVDPIWTLIVVAAAPTLLLPIVLVQRYIRRKSMQARESAARMSLRLDEILHGIATIKLNRLEAFQLGRYARENERRVTTETKSEFGRTLMPAMIDVLTGLGFLGVLIYGGAEIITGEKSVGQFMSFFTAMALAFDPVRRLANLSGALKTAAASVERVQEILDEEPAISSPARPAPMQVGDITFDNVSVRFGDAAALDGFSMTAKRGETTALVGTSGAGKSTVFNALTRLAPLSAGQISIGEADITKVDLNELRDTFSVVSQDALLFDDSLRDNIAFDWKHTPEALETALSDAHVADFRSSLPQGLDSPAGPRGSNISGGQRQRVAIARALLRDAPILLLDEATSALDSESEGKVQEAFDRLSEGRTTLVIAHRLSTIRRADKIIVMEHGRVVEEGTHEALMARNGAYARLHSLQFEK